MTDNLSLRYAPAVVFKAISRNIDLQSVLNGMANPLDIVPGNLKLREGFIVNGFMNGEPYPIFVPVSAATDGINCWQTIKSVIPKREYKHLIFMLKPKVEQ